MAAKKTVAKEGPKLTALEARVAALEAPRQEVVLTTSDGKFTVELSLAVVPNLSLRVTAEVRDATGKPLPGAGEANLATWSVHQGTLIRVR
ncbi:MAG: hypothetical protein WA005_12055 [Candidatus Binataceae bacterium]